MIFVFLEIEITNGFTTMDWTEPIDFNDTSVVINYH